MMLYKILRPLIKFITCVFIRPKYFGLENIPKKGRIVLAGNHINNLDCFLVISATKRSVHFLAKNELWKGLKKILFSNMGLIPVNRQIHDHNALMQAEKYLTEDKVIGIFPEGTTEKGRGLLSFKKGVVKMAKHTNSNIIPFVITGDYRLFANNLKITFGKPLIVKTDNFDIEINKLRNIMNKMMEV